MRPSCFFLKYKILTQLHPHFMKHYDYKYLVDNITFIIITTFDQHNETNIEFENLYVIKYVFSVNAKVTKMLLPLEM